MVDKRKVSFTSVWPGQLARHGKRVEVTAQRHVQLSLQKKKDVAGMTKTRGVLGMEDEHCQGCRTQRRRLLSAGHVMCNFDRGRLMVPL